MGGGGWLVRVVCCLLLMFAVGRCSLLLLVVWSSLSLCVVRCLLRVVRCCLFALPTFAVGCLCCCMLVCAVC